MEENAKYFVGYEVDGEIIRIEVELTPEFQICSISSNRLKNIDFFTQTFDYKTFLDFLRARKLINVFEEVKLYKKDINPATDLEEITELRGGFAFSESIPYFQVNKINKYFNDHITNLEFLIAANDFFKKYFGLKKPMPKDLSNSEYEKFLADTENTPRLYFSYCKLFLYLKFLKDKKPLERKRNNIKERQRQENNESLHIGDCRTALVKMLKEILGTDEENLNYEGLHDLALFISNFEQEYHLEKVTSLTQDHFPGSQSKGYAQSNERDDMPRLF